MQELIEYIAESLVDEPAEVEVTERRRQDTILYELSVAEPDMGRVIGKGGRVANAMRQILRASATIQDEDRVELDIVD